MLRKAFVPARADVGATSPFNSDTNGSKNKRPRTSQAKDVDEEGQSTRGCIFSTEGKTASRIYEDIIKRGKQKIVAHTVCVRFVGCSFFRRGKTTAQQ